MMESLRITIGIILQYLGIASPREAFSTLQISRGDVPFVYETALSTIPLSPVAVQVRSAKYQPGKALQVKMGTTKKGTQTHITSYHKRCLLSTFQGVSAVTLSAHFPHFPHFPLSKAFHP